MCNAKAPSRLVSHTWRNPMLMSYGDPQMSPIYGNALWLAPGSRLRRSQLPETKQNTDTPDRMFAFHCSEHG